MPVPIPGLKVGSDTQKVKFLTIFGRPKTGFFDEISAEFRNFPKFPLATNHAVLHDTLQTSRNQTSRTNQTRNRPDGRNACWKRNIRTRYETMPNQLLRKTVHCRCRPPVGLRFRWGIPRIPWGDPLGGSPGGIPWGDWGDHHRFWVDSGWILG